MDSLSDSLLALLTPTTTEASQSLKARDDELKSTNRAAIEEQRTILDSLLDPSATTTATVRAKLVCTASKLIFGPAVVDPEDPNYHNSQQKNWFLLHS
jgi:hypothetical protein